MSNRNIINTKNLKIEDIPPENANWHEISLFALSFDYMAELHETKLDPNIWTYNDASSIQELRAYVYHKQRWWNNRTGPIDENDLEDIRRAINLIRINLIR